MGREILVDRLDDEGLERAATPVADFGGDVGLGTTRAQCRGGEQGGDAGTVLSVEGDVAIGIRRGLLDDLGGLVCGHAQRDAVLVALGHLAPIQAGHLDDVGEDAFGLGEDRGVALVETTRDRTRDLDVGELVLANGNDVALAEENVAGLVNRIVRSRPVSA